jgi:hypothetical protein
VAASRAVVLKRRELKWLTWILCCSTRSVRILDYQLQELSLTTLTDYPVSNRGAGLPRSRGFVLGGVSGSNSPNPRNYSLCGRGRGRVIWYQSSPGRRRGRSRGHGRGGFNLHPYAPRSGLVYQEGPYL